MLPKVISQRLARSISPSRATQSSVTDTGAIEGVRAANDDPVKSEVKDGIGFRLADDGQGHKVAVWSFADAHDRREQEHPLRTSANAAALVAKENLTIVGIVDARGYDANGTLCGDNQGGPGGGIGGKAAPATGAGAGIVHAGGRVQRWPERRLVRASEAKAATEAMERARLAPPRRGTTCARSHLVGEARRRRNVMQEAAEAARFSSSPAARSASAAGPRWAA